MINSYDSVFMDIDLNTVTIEELDFSKPYSVNVNRDDKVHGVCTWFDIEFGGVNVKDIVRFSTSPFAEYTHWKQTMFYFD